MTTEATRTETQEREGLIAETLRDEGRAEMPLDPIVSKGDSELPIEDPMTIKEVSAAGYKWIWDTKSYEKIPVLWYMLPAKLRQRNPDGSYRFTPIDPKKMPYRGVLKCMLHKEDPNRKHWDELGFRYCKKSNLTNPYERNRHMRMKHPKEWESIEMERVERERKEDRALQAAILGKIAQNEVKPEVKEEERELYISDKDKKKK